MSCDELEKYILFQSPFTILNASDCNKIKDENIGSRNGARHMIVHQIHCKCALSSNIRPPKEYLVATITLLDSFATPVIGYDRTLVELTKVIEYLYKHNSNKNREFFSTIKRESIGKSFYSRLKNT